MSRDLHQISREDSEEPPEPPQLRSLRLLVTLLTATMILAMLVIAAAVVFRVITPNGAPVSPASMTDIPVEDGYTVLSVSRTGDRLILLIEEDNGGRMIEERGTDQRLLGRYRLVPAD